MKKETYTIHFDVNLHGWEEGLDVEVQAETQWEACRILGKALTKLCKKPSKSAPTKGVPTTRDKVNR